MALKSLLLTAGFCGNLLWTWNQSLPFRGKSLWLSLLSEVWFMVKKKRKRKKPIKTTGLSARKAASEQIRVAAAAGARWAVQRRALAPVPKTVVSTWRLSEVSGEPGLCWGLCRSTWDATDLWGRRPSRGFLGTVIQIWDKRYCSYSVGVFLGAPQVSPFLTDFCLRIFPHRFHNLTDSSRLL